MTEPTIKPTPKELEPLEDRCEEARLLATALNEHTSYTAIVELDRIKVRIGDRMITLICTRVANSRARRMTHA